ncbi:hypothetical protein N7519_005986 [Penicillium mononematosum]|uniref:uncharacterized protein n=1 Tax=Penicillium mononematosum TaxID=268346 RepID=UPI002547E226|nr:uncharacterized protein N7519_005986 [Penicillium mononematosum]KAJ6184685.1 hypothetical protein N7519_005986 [Penicillium mononematosum]
MSLRLTQLAQKAYDPPFGGLERGQESNSSLGQLCLLVILAVSEVIMITLAGYILARLRLFDAEKRKFLSNLNIMLFTPCLIFTMLASQLNTANVLDLAIIPVIFIVQLLVSLLAARGVSKAFRFGHRASNFITAMSVFANSNSLPPPLVLSLSRTLKGLHWDRIPGDNDDEVAARGIFYIVIFQQLSNLLRWSWGYHVLLAPKHKYPEYQEQNAEEGQNYRDEPENNEYETGPLIDVYGSDSGTDEGHSSYSQGHEPAGSTPVTGHSQLSIPAGVEELPNKKSFSHRPLSYSTLNGHDDSRGLLARTSSDDGLAAASQEEVKGLLARVNYSIKSRLKGSRISVAGVFVRLYQKLPGPIQATERWSKPFWDKTINFLLEVMNPPLWAMLIAVLVSSFPGLQRALFEVEFIKNSVTSAIQSIGNVAVPLMLIGLGANLGRNATPEEEEDFDPEEDKIGTRLLIASLVSRMVIPTVVLAPIMLMMVKYLDFVILEDPIFVIICFLLSGAPTALQLAQICQVNNAFEKTMDRILFHSYAIW